VYDGQAVYEGQNSALTVNPGQHAEFWIDANNVAQYAMSGPSNDAFAGWGQRTRPGHRHAGPRPINTSPPEDDGAPEDLDRYGSWGADPRVRRAVGRRRVVARPNWAPYRAGHWAWVSPWGWDLGR